jgi:hypothetical protein
MTETDELYQSRLLPYIDGTPNPKFAQTFDSIFDGEDDIKNFS